MKKVKLKFIQDNYGWIVAIITGIGVIFTFILKFINYLYSKIKFSYYGLDYGMYIVEDTGIIYNFCFSILLILCFYSLCYCYYQIFKICKKKEQNKSMLIENILIILLSNIFIISCSGYSISWKTALLEFFILVILEIIMTIIISKMITTEINVKNPNQYFLNYLKRLPFVVLFLILMLLVCDAVSFINNKEFRIVNENKVIVYTTSDYYLLLDCEINNNEIIIYKGNQTKIDNKNTKSKFLKFEKVKVIDN